MKHMGFVFISGRGIVYNGYTSLVINEFDKGKRFYAPYKIEYTLGFIAKKCKNVYLIGIFSLERTIYDPKLHTGFLNKDEKSIKCQFLN